MLHAWPRRLRNQAPEQALPHGTTKRLTINALGVSGTKPPSRHFYNLTIENFDLIQKVAGTKPLRRHFYSKKRQ
jgi:hypothetical protein